MKDFLLFDKKKTAYFTCSIGDGKSHFSGSNNIYKIKIHIQSQLAEKGHTIPISDIEILKIDD